MSERFNICLFGLSITSSWGNGHATTYRALVRELCGRGHEVLFFERDVPWYTANRDLPNPPYGRTVLYSSLEELRQRFSNAVGEADLLIVGSFVPEGVALGELVTRTVSGVTAFYDIDTPVTLSVLFPKCRRMSASKLASARGRAYFQSTHPLTAPRNSKATYWRL